MDLSIIIVNYNVYDDVKICVESINKYLNKLTFEIIVVDNNSPDRSILNIKQDFKDVNFIELSSNKGFGHANNAAMQRASGRYFILVNPDIIFQDNSIEIMYDFLENCSLAGVVGAVQYKPGSVQEYYYTYFPSIYSRLMQENRMYMRARLMKKRFFDFLETNIKRGVPFKTDWVIGSCMMLRREIYDDIGGFDEAFFLYEEETEWQFRMRQKGWQSYIHPGAKVLHNHHSSTAKLGKMFVYYHEFRSRIIFDHKRLKGLKYFVRISLIDIGLFLRVIYFSIRSLFSRSMKIKLRAYFDLFIFNNRSRQFILNSRYDFEKKKYLFA